MIRNKDFTLLYAGRAVFTKENEFAGVVVGWNDMHGVILGIGHADGWQSWGANDIGVSEEEAPRPRTVCEIIKEHEGVQGIQFSTDEHGNVQAAYIRGKNGGMKLVSMGDGLENVSSKI